MKITHLKKLIKEAVKEAIQEELKEVLLEAIKTPKTQPINENISINTIPPNPSFESPTTNVRQNYSDIMNETAKFFVTADQITLLFAQQQKYIF